SGAIAAACDATEGGRIPCGVLLFFVREAVRRRDREVTAAADYSSRRVIVVAKTTGGTTGEDEHVARIRRRCFWRRTSITAACSRRATDSGRSSATDSPKAGPM